MKRILPISAALLLMWTSYGLAKTLAQCRTWTWRLSVNLTGESHDEDCRLSLSAETHDRQKEIDIKDPGYLCSFYGPIQLLGADTPERDLTYIYLEGARGGDGDHTGPMVEVYKLTPKNGFTKLGEQELFGASYHRTNEMVTSVTGNVLFSFCDVCDGPEAGDPEYMIYVPVILTTAGDNLAIKPSVGKKDRDVIWKRFESLKEKDKREILQDETHKAYVIRIEKSLRELLSR